MQRKERPEALRFGSELRRIRTGRGFTQMQLGSACHISTSLISGFERGTHWPRRDTAEALDQKLRASGNLLKQWVEMSNRQAYPDWLGALVEAEPQATLLREYETVVVPGLLQTGAYAETLVRAADSLSSEQRVAELVAGRMHRQKLWESDPHPHMMAIVNEAVLLSPVGGADVMRAQVEHIISWVECHRIGFQIIPFETENHPGMSGPFKILSFRVSADVLYVEDAVSGTMIHDSDQVKRMTMLFGGLQAVALSPERSLKRLHEIREGFRGEGTQDVAQVELQRR